jgi:hypothetical protein
MTCLFVQKNLPQKSKENFDWMLDIDINALMGSLIYPNVTNMM